MKKFFIALFSVILLVAVGFLAFGEDYVWFDTLHGESSFTDDQKAAVIRYIQGDKEDVSALQGSSRDTILFLSLSDGEDRAKVYFGVGDGMLHALDDLLMKVPENEREDAVWYKVDLVSDVLEIKDPDFDLPLGFERSIYGLAFDQITNVAFLPEELTANTLMNSDLEVRFGNIEDYFEEEEIYISTSLLQDTESVYYFSTDSFFFDKNSLEAVDLYRGHEMYDEVTADSLLEAATAGGKYLAAAVREDGSFVYDYLPKTDKENDDYNILRHAGTVYSMVELYEVTQDEELKAAIDRAVGYLVDSIELCYSAPNGELCLVEDGEVKLGGNGLAMVALVEYMNVTGSRAYLAKAQGLALWIASTADEGGHLAIHKLNNETGEIDDFESYYYPGEAILGLIRLYQLDGNSRWLDLAENEARYIIEIRDVEETIDTIEHDHWFLYGLNELYRANPQEMYLDHAALIVEAITTMQRTENPEYEDWLGSYYTPPRTTPTATRSEGLMAAYNLFTYAGDTETAARALAAANLGVIFDLGTQIGPPLAMYVYDPQRVIGAFHENLTDYSIRIDYVQHNISALLALRESMLDLESPDL